MKTYEKYKDNGVLFVGLTPDGSSATSHTQKFIDDYGLPWANAVGAQATIDALGVSGYPTLFVVGADGKILWNDEMGGSLEEAIEKALGQA